MENGTPCDFNTLKKAYDLVMKSLSENWIKSELKDYPTILHTKSEEDYILFVKREKNLPDESVLMQLLAEQLDVSKFMFCQSDWKGKNVTGTYLWIKKENLEQILDKFNINRI